jgi:hypothetical protein
MPYNIVQPSESLFVGLCEKSFSTIFNSLQLFEFFYDLHRQYFKQRVFELHVSNYKS